MNTPWARARKLKSQLQEERLGKLEGGSKQVNSGRFWNFKRDAKLHEFLVEARTTENQSYRIEHGEWLAIRKDAHYEPPGLKPAMQVTIQGLELMVIELQDFQDLYVRQMIDADES